MLFFLKFLREVPSSPLFTKIKEMINLMHLYEGFDVYYILIFSHNTQALIPVPLHSRTNLLPSSYCTSSAQAERVEPLITSPEFLLVSFLLFLINQPGLLSSGAVASDL